MPVSRHRGASCGLSEARRGGGRGAAPRQCHGHEHPGQRECTRGQPATADRRGGPGGDCQAERRQQRHWMKWIVTWRTNTSVHQ